MSDRILSTATARFRMGVALASVTLAATALGAWGAGSASAHVRVAAAVMLNPPPAAVDTGLPATFTGTVTPAYAGERVALQRLRRNGHWTTLAVGFVTTPSGTFAVTHVFGHAARGGSPATLRVKVPRNAMSLRAFSTPFAITIIRIARPHHHNHHVRREERRQRREERRRDRRQLREERRRHHREKLEERRRRKQERRKLRSAHGHRGHRV